MTMAEKILATHVVGADRGVFLKPGDAVCARADGGYSHEFTTAQVHLFLEQEYGPDYTLANPAKYAVFEDHLIYADGVAKMAPFAPKIQKLREVQRAFQRKTGVQDYSARDGISPGICHTIARERIIEPGDFIQATDSHTTMGGSLGALAYGVGTTEYAALIKAGFTFVEVPESIRFELTGRLRAGVTAKDVMLYILANYARRQLTLDRAIEFGGAGLRTLSPDERAVLANMATECSAKAGLVEVDEATLAWIAARRPGVDLESLRRGVAHPDPGAEYAGGVHEIDLGRIEPMVATPGDSARGIPSDPTNGALIAELGDVAIQIAYGGSCTAGKEDDLDQYASVMREALEAGRGVRPGVDFYIQFGSAAVEEYARRRGYLDIFAKTGVKVIHPGCGACIGCGPGVSTSPDQVTVSAINRNYQNRSGPGRLYLASPLSVAASAVEGRIVAYREGMWRG
jgi:3-isopropylmalate/(R)-2-methylmalate dehydratase large subunit